MVIDKSQFTDEVLRRLHATQVEILDEIVRICDKHGLRYYLAEGTLLGAVRHEGFIPWDDDLDIAMPREDYETFFKLCETELSSQYYAHSQHTDENYLHIFGKIRKHGTLFEEGSVRHLPSPQGIFVDIFPLDRVKRERGLIKRLREKCVGLSFVVIKCKLGICRPQTPAVRIGCFLARFMSVRQISKRAEKWIRRQNRGSADYVISYGSGYDSTKHTIPKEKYEPAVRVKFEGKFYTAPCDSDYLLRRIYGDYMQPPPEEDRIWHHQPERLDFGD